MLKFMLLITLIACTSGAVVPKGMLPQLDGRIVDGKPTSVRSTPWQGSLQRDGFHLCGCSILNVRIMVTAAHCLINANIRILRVRVGSSLWISGGNYISVAALKIHELYNPKTMTHDIAIFKLETPLVFSSTIRPIPLASVTPKDGAQCTVSGWGTTKSGADSSPTQLKSVDVTIMSYTNCTSSEYGNLILPSMLCAHSAGKDSCQGDSGGPLVSGGKLVGVVSWGIGCAFPSYPGVYANVAELRPWVLKNAEVI